MNQPEIWLKPYELTSFYPDLKAGAIDLLVPYAEPDVCLSQGNGIAA